MSFFFLLALVPELLAGLLNAFLSIIAAFTGGGTTAAAILFLIGPVCLRPAVERKRLLRRAA